MRPLLFGVYLAGVVLIVFWPQPVDSGAAGFLDGAILLLHGWGAPRWITYEFIEFTANIVMFLPFGFLFPGSRRAAARRVPAAAAAGLLTSAAIELAQLLLLPARVASIWDVVANTAGALLGACAYLLLGLRRAKSPGRVDSAP